MSGDVTPPGVAISLVLVVVAVAISGWQRLGLGRSIAWSAARALVQLVAIGAALLLVVSPDSPLWPSWLWLGAMVLFAAHNAARRAPEVPRLRLVALVAFAFAAVVTLGIIFGLGVFPTEARTVVPLGGLMIGNSMIATVLVARRVAEELRDKAGEVEARLALGHSWWVAARSHVRDAVRTALIPQIETTRTVGIVFLPGAMTGLILAGVDPVDAVLVQVVVMYLVLGATSTTTLVVAFGTAQRLFTADHRLVRLPRSG